MSDSDAEVSALNGARFRKAIQVGATLVRAQAWQRREKLKWAYVLAESGHHPYVSAYRYGTEDTALAAGERDADECEGLAARGASA